MSLSMNGGWVLRARGLGAEAGPNRLLSGVDLDLAPGRVLAVLGPSGSGKSTLGLALLDEARAGIRLTGRVEADGRIGYLPQHPGTALDPVRRVVAVLDELAATVHGRDRAARRAAVTSALRTAQLTDDALLRRHPHQLSGGEAQRVALAQTLVVGPAAVVLDEPTTALDPRTSAALVADLARLASSGTALVLLTHDRGVARALAHDVVVLRDGHIERRGPAATTLDDDHLTAPPAADPDAPVTASRLRARDVTVRPVLDGVSLDVGAGRAVAVVGPSGAGKTTLARSLAGLTVPRAGSIEVDDRPLPPDALDRDRSERRAVQYVHQDPRATFLARRSVLDQAARPGVLLRGLDRERAHAEAQDLLDELGLDPDIARRRPGALSGGQLARAALARALMARPAVLVADEVTAALDAEHRARVLALLDRMRTEHGTTVIVVSHDLELVARACASALVMAGGRIVDRGPIARMLAR